MKTGQPGKRGEAVAALRVVGFHTGSAVMKLEPITDESAEEEMFPDAGTLAVANLTALLDAIEAAELFDAGVTEALSSARRALGPDGRIGVVTAWAGRPRRVVIDEERIDSLARRSTPQVPGVCRVSGRLHMIDVEPPHKVGIRAPDGVEWLCRYPVELEEKVKTLLDETVWARGTGQITAAQRGTLEIEEIHPVGQFEDTQLFTWERVPLGDLMDQQGIYGPQGESTALPDDVTDEEVDRFLDAVLDD